MIALLRLSLAIVTSLFKSRTRLEAENTALRQQLVVLRRKVRGRVKLTNGDRVFFVWLHRLFPSVRPALVLVQPETLIRWHRAGFRRYWLCKSRRRLGRPPVYPELRDLIQRMSRENALWGAERIRGELLKLGIEVAKRTIQRYVPQRPEPREPSQTWATFLKTHAKDIWAVDFVPVIDLLFRQLFVFFIVELESRRVVHFGVTRHPSQFWAAQ